MRSSLENGSELSEPDDLYTICPLLWLFPQLQPELKCSSCLNKGELTEGAGEPPADAVRAWEPCWSFCPKPLEFLVQADGYQLFGEQFWSGERAEILTEEALQMCPQNLSASAALPLVLWNTRTGGSGSVPRNTDSAWGALQSGSFPPLLVPQDSIVVSDPCLFFTLLFLPANIPHSDQIYFSKSAQI